MLVKLSILLAFLSCACSSAVVEVDTHCEWGESHWCSSIRTAKQCGAVTHCSGTVWKNHQLLQKHGQNDQICTYCENIITDVRNFLGDQKSQLEIKKYLDEACAIIPEQQMATECKTVVDTYLVEILNMITMELDPKMICAAMGLCPGLRDRVPHTIVIAEDKKICSRVGNTYCADCKKFIGDIQEMIESNTTESQVEQFLEDNICRGLGEMQVECDDLVKMYVPEIIGLVASQVNPGLVCQMIGFCMNSTKEGAKIMLRNSPLYQALRSSAFSAEECDVCKYALAELQNLDRNAQTQAAIESFVTTNVCPNLGPLTQECKDAVKTYGHAFFELLANELDPTTDCKALGFCSAKSVAAHIRMAAGYKKQSSVRASAQCIMCEFVMKEVEQMLSQNATEEEITAALEKVCSLLPSTVATECKSFVDAYAPAIIQLLAHELDPQLVCTTLGLCASKTQHKARPEPRKHMGISSSEMCGMCEIVVQYVDSLLAENATVVEIQKVLDKVCNFLPTDLQKQCVDLIAQYEPELLQLLTQLADPRKICTELRLCNDTKLTVPVKRPIAVPYKSVIQQTMTQVKQAVQPVLGLVHLLGSHKCTFGPAYWCASLDNAKRCQAVAHCKKHVWKN